INTQRQIGYLQRCVCGSYNVLRAHLECREGNVAAIATQGVRRTGLGLEASKSVQEKDPPGRNGRC
ncbi:MAG: hypothetical protein M3N13_08580, partial [Candidatus Eremiobacteraeota bacterium]|nr:hypothetical protein [Candidatus Eremiobacteraeota bacterium]